MWLRRGRHPALCVAGGIRALAARGADTLSRWGTDRAADGLSAVGAVGMAASRVLEPALVFDVPLRPHMAVVMPVPVRTACAVAVRELRVRVADGLGCGQVEQERGVVGGAVELDVLVAEDEHADLLSSRDSPADDGMGGEIRRARPFRIVRVNGPRISEDCPVGAHALLTRRRHRQPDGHPFWPVDSFRVGA